MTRLWRNSAQPQREMADIESGAARRACVVPELWQYRVVVASSSKAATTSCKDRYPSPTARPDPIGVRPQSCPTPSNDTHAGFRASGGTVTHQFLAVETLTCANEPEMALVCASGATKTGEILWQTRSNSRPFWPLSQHFRPAVRPRSNAPRPVLSGAQPLHRFWARISAQVRLSAARPVVLALVPSTRTRRAASRLSQFPKSSTLAAGA